MADRQTATAKVSSFERPDLKWQVGKVGKWRAAHPDNLTSIPGIHRKEKGQNGLGELSSDPCTPSRPRRHPSSSHNRAQF